MSSSGPMLNMACASVVRPGGRPGPQSYPASLSDERVDRAAAGSIRGRGPLALAPDLRGEGADLLGEPAHGAHQHEGLAHQAGEHGGRAPGSTGG